MVHRLGALLPLALCLGCYSYRPAPVETLAPGDQVRVLVSRELTDALRDAIPGDARRVEGQVVQPGDTLLLEVAAGVRQVGFHSRTLTQRLGLPRDAVLDVERRRLDRTRTLAVSATAGLVVGAITWKILSGETGGYVNVGPGGPREIVVPLLSVPVR